MNPHQLIASAKSEYSRYNLDNVIHHIDKLRNDPSLYDKILSKLPTNKVPTFITCGMIDFAMRFSSRSNPGTISNQSELYNLLLVAKDYLLSDPISWDEETSSSFFQESPSFTMMRILYSQHKYEGSRWEIARAY